MKEYNNIMKNLLIISMLTLIIVQTAHGGNPLCDSSRVFSSIDYELIANTGTVIEKGLVGKAVHLEKKQYIKVIPPAKFSYKQGTIMLWLKPAGGYYDNINDKLKSHSFISFKWSNGGYFVLSDGWWEKNGGHLYTYYVFDNEVNRPLKTKYKYIKDKWVHFAVSWKSGLDGHLRFFVNGELVGEKSLETNTIHHPVGPIHIGSDKGSNHAGNRWFAGDVDEFLIFDHSINQKELHSILTDQTPRWRTMKYEWIKETIESKNNERFLANKKTIKAIFDEGPLPWRTSYEAKKTVEKIKKAGFNVYIPCVWHGDGTRYPSGFAPSAKYKGKNDPLRDLIEIAHRNNIEVHPWFTVVYRSRDFLTQYYDVGTPPKAFEVHNKKFRDFMVNLILDVVRRYDIDGINLDYIRSMGFSNSEVTKKLYNDIYGRDYQVDKKTYDENGYLEPHLQEFVDSAVKDIVQRVYIGTKKIKPHVIVSVDGHPKAKWLPHSYQGRREKVWKNEGLIDLIFALSYERIPDIEGLKYVQNEINDPHALIPVVGNFDRVGTGFASRDPEVLGELVQLVQKTFGGSFAVYPFSLLTDKHVNTMVNLSN